MVVFSSLSSSKHNNRSDWMRTSSLNNKDSCVRLNDWVWIRVINLSKSLISGCVFFISGAQTCESQQEICFSRRSLGWNDCIIFTNHQNIWVQSNKSPITQRSGLVHGHLSSSCWSSPAVSALRLPWRHPGAQPISDSDTPKPSIAAWRPGQTKSCLVRQKLWLGPWKLHSSELLQEEPHEIVISFSSVHPNQTKSCCISEHASLHASCRSNNWAPPVPGRQKKETKQRKHWGQKSHARGNCQPLCPNLAGAPSDHQCPLVPTFLHRYGLLACRPTPCRTSSRRRLQPASEGSLHVWTPTWL